MMEVSSSEVLTQKIMEWWSDMLQIAINLSLFFICALEVVFDHKRVVERLIIHAYTFNKLSNNYLYYQLSHDRYRLQYSIHNLVQIASLSPAHQNFSLLF